MRKYGRASNHPKLKSYQQGGVVTGGPTPEQYAADLKDETLAAIEEMKYGKRGVEANVEAGSIPADARGYPVRNKGNYVSGNVEFPVGEVTFGVGVNRENVNLGGVKKRPGGLSDVSVGIPFAGGELKAAYGRRREEGEVDRRFTIEFSKKF